MGDADMADEGTTATDQQPAAAETRTDPTWESLRQAWEEGGLTPGQVLGRLEASRKWETRAKAAPTPEELADLRAKAERAEALDYELSSEKDKAVADAKKESAAEVNARYQPRLVNAEFRVAAAGRIEPERLATILEPLDLSKFLTSDGEVDTDKVTAFVDGIAPAMGNQHQSPRTGPTTTGQGNRSGNTRSVAGHGSVSAGRDLYAEMHAPKSSR